MAEKSNNSLHFSGFYGKLDIVLFIKLIGGECLKASALRIFMERTLGIIDVLKRVFGSEPDSKFDNVISQEDAALLSSDSNLERIVKDCEKRNFNIIQPLTPEKETIREQIASKKTKSPSKSRSNVPHRVDIDRDDK